VALTPVPAMTLTQAKTLTPIEPPSEAVAARDSDEAAETEPTPAPPLPLAARPAVVVAPADDPAPAAVPSAAERRNATIVLSPSAESPSAISARAAAVTPDDLGAASSPANSLSVAVPRSSILGVSPQRLQIRVDGPRERTTSRETDVISGVLVGGQPRRLEVQLGDAVTTAKVDGLTFSAGVSLKPGLNRVRVVAADSLGRDVEETVTIQYNVPSRVVITGPSDGHTIRADDPPFVIVQGDVDDPGVSSVWLIAGPHRFAVPVTAGRFRHAVPVLEPTVRVRVETPPMGNRLPASATVTVHALPTPTIAVLLHWPNHTAVPVEVAVAWRPRADRLDGAVQRIPLGTADESANLTMYYLRNPQPGVYTFVLTSSSRDAQLVQPALHVPGAVGGLRALPAVTLNGGQRVLVARVLLPHGVLWEQDDWFTGRSANGNTVTKFRFPDGISWSERVGSPW